MTAGEIVIGVSRRFWAGPLNGEHMPFEDHRTVAEVWETCARRPQLNRVTNVRCR